MATVVNKPNDQDSAPAQGSNSSSGANNNPFSKISSGPAALAQLLIYQIMALYAEIINLDQKQKVNMVTAQSTAAQAQAQETIAGGNALFNMYLASGILTIGGAALGLGIQEIGSRVGEGAQSAEAEAKAQKKFDADKSIEKALTKPPAQLQGGQQPVAGANAEEAAARREEFLSGDFKKASENKANTKEAIRLMKPITDANGLEQPQLDGMGREIDYKTWESRFQENKVANSRDYNSAVQRRSTYQNRLSAFKGLGEQACQATSSFTNAAYNAQKAQHDANSALEQAASQMAGSAASDFGQGLNKAFDSQNAEVQILENINRTNSVSG